MSAPPHTAQRAGLRHPPLSRAWAIVGALSVTETVSWGIVYYAFAVFLLPMRRELGFSTAELTGAFSLALLISGVAGIAVGRYLDRRSPRALMTAGSIAGVLLVFAWSRVEGLAAYVKGDKERAAEDLLTVGEEIKSRLRRTDSENKPS